MNPWSTFEFNPDKCQFFPELDDEGCPHVIIPLQVGRVHHSLAATCGMIFCTGGHPNYLRGEGEDEAFNDDSLGKVVEVFNVKMRMWTTYTNQLKNSRYGHSSCIMGEHLYLFHGYDAQGSVIGDIDIVSFTIPQNEAMSESDYSIKFYSIPTTDSVPPFTRLFTSIYANESCNKIVYFGYCGLLDNVTDPNELITLRKESPDQQYHKFMLTDEEPRYTNSSNPDKKLREEKEERERANREIEGRQILIEKLKDQGEPPEEEYIHHPVSFRGMTILPTFYRNKRKFEHI